MKIALIGNQNSGKTSLFNALTAKKEAVGNRAGVTVGERSSAMKGKSATIVDLPGTYSLTAYTPEERVTTDFFEREKDVLYVNVIDGTTLRRGLYLTLSLIEKGADMIVAVNMADVCFKQGIEINRAALENALNRRVILISVKKKIGVNELIAACFEKRKDEQKGFQNEIRSHFSCGEDCVEARYKAVEKIYSECVTIRKKKKSASDAIDDVLLNKYFSIPIFVAVMSLVFILSVGSVGNAATKFLEKALTLAKIKIKSGLSPAVAPALISLITDGVLTGVGTVLTFLPRLVFLFLFLGIMEGCGYTARIAFIFDALLKKIDLDGRSLVPLILGFGCSVPAVQSAKTISLRRTHDLSVILVPFVPCSAKLPLIALFADFYFYGNSGAVAALIYFLSMISVVVSAKLISAVMGKRRSDGYYFELPDYKFPSVSALFKDVGYKTLSFIKRSGTVIFLSSVVVWALSRFTPTLSFTDDIKTSLLYFSGGGLSYLLYPVLGKLNPAAAFSTLAGLIAKEQIVSSMAVIGGAESARGIFLSGAFSFTRPEALSFLVFNVFCMPCISALSSVRAQLKSRKRFLFALFYQNSFAYLLAALTGFIARIAGL